MHIHVFVVLVLFLLGSFSFPSSVGVPSQMFQVYQFCFMYLVPAMRWIIYRFLGLYFGCFQSCTTAVLKFYILFLVLSAFIKLLSLRMIVWECLFRISGHLCNMVACSIAFPLIDQTQRMQARTGPDRPEGHAQSDFIQSRNPLFQPCVILHSLYMNARISYFS